MPSLPVAVRSPGQTSVGSPIAEKPTEKDESQNWQTRLSFGSTAPHCEHVFVTGKFCAADASTPVRRELDQHTTPPQMSSRNLRKEVAKEAMNGSGGGPEIKHPFAGPAYRG